MGTFYTGDIDRLFPNYMVETLRLFGTPALFYETLTETKDIYTDNDISSFVDPVSVNILYTEYPRNIKTLQRIGWYNKESEDNPAIAYVPLKIDILKRWQKVLLPGNSSSYTDVKLWRPYQVTKISSTMEHPYYTLIALAPIFADNSPTIDRTKNSNFLNVNL